MAATNSQSKQICIHQLSSQYVHMIHNLQSAIDTLSNGQKFVLKAFVKAFQIPHRNQSENQTFQYINILKI